MSFHVQLEEFWPNCLEVPGQGELCGWFNTMLLMLPEFLGCSKHCVNEHCHDEGAMSFSANLLSLFVLIKSEIPL